MYGHKQIIGIWLEVLNQGIYRAGKRWREGVGIAYIGSTKVRSGRAYAVYTSETFPEAHMPFFALPTDYVYHIVAFFLPDPHHSGPCQVIASLTWNLESES